MKIESVSQVSGSSHYSFITHLRNVLQKHSFPVGEDTNQGVDNMVLIMNNE